MIFDGSWTGFYAVSCSILCLALYNYVFLLCSALYLQWVFFDTVCDTVVFGVLFGMVLDGSSMGLRYRNLYVFVLDLRCGLEALFLCHHGSRSFNDEMR
jgi:hypothetical protein